VAEKLGVRLATAASDQVAFGLIGTGAQGQYLLAHFNRIGSGRVAAVCDINRENLRMAVQISRDKPQEYADYRALLDRKDINAIVIATPLPTHFPITRDALLAGKHVYCEKPLVFKTEEIAALRKLADSRSDQILQVGFPHRYSKFYQVAKQMVSKGFIGELTHVRAQWHRNPGWVMKTGGKEANWRLFRETSGGLAAELGSHQIDVSDWMFADTPEYVTGVGGLDWARDGRDVYDNISLIFNYPRGKMIYTAISTNRHLPMFGGSRTEFGELLIGTEGSIEITLGTDTEPTLGLWYIEPSPKVRSEESQELVKMAGASVSPAGRYRAMPILFERDQLSGEESFAQRELKYARRWLYAKGFVVPKEERNAVDVQLESFLDCCRTGRTPKADLEAGLNNSAAIIAANAAVDSGRRVYLKEIEPRP
jgi:predicted dehydrogenase